MQVARYEQLRVAALSAKTVDEAKDIADKATALAAYARQANDPQLEIWVAEIRVRAKRRVGELSAALPVSKGGANPSATLPSGGKSKSEVLQEAGLTTSEAGRCEQLASVAESAFEEFIASAAASGKVITGDMVARMVSKLARKKVVANKAEAAGIDCCSVSDLDALLAAGRKFGTIYADPPWVYDNQATRAATSDHYAGLTVDQLCELPVRELAADDAHLHLWTTNAFLFDAPRIFAAWGFEFRSSFVWVKPQMGIGNYWRNSHEFLLTAIRGNAKRFNDHSLMSWGRLDRRKHSAKPEEVRGFIERASQGPFLELFGRRQAPGWTVWGNEVARDLLYQEAA
jgi:N6-adenosine-specific RNA methylase IME4